MRTAPVALAYLDDPDALIEAAQTVSALTHHDPEAGEACALWCLAIRHAVLHGSFDGLRLALADLPHDRAVVWSARLDEAEAHPPQHFAKNGWVVEALQGAWSAIYRTPVPVLGPAAGRFPAQHLQHALEAAVAGGRDTDTVAAIAGGLLGARWGASAVPAVWRRIVHGWPGYHAHDLIQLALLTVNQGQDDALGWPSVPVLDYTAWGDTSALAIHPNDPGVWLGGVNAVRDLPDEVGAVISLCRLGSAEVPAPGVEPCDHVEVWLIDQPDPEANPNLDFVLHDTARTLASMRGEGHTVLVHCVQAISRTPTLAIAHAVRNLGVPIGQASADVTSALPDAAPNMAFVTALDRLAGGRA